MGETLEEEARRLEEEHSRLCRDSSDPRRGSNLLAELRALVSSESEPRELTQFLASALNTAAMAALSEDGPGYDLGLAEEYAVELRELADDGPLASGWWRRTVMFLAGPSMKVGLTSKALGWLRELEILCDDPACAAECRQDYAYALQATIGYTGEPSLRTSLMARLEALGRLELRDPEIQGDVAEGWALHAGRLKEEGDSSGVERALSSLLDVLNRRVDPCWEEDRVRDVNCWLLLGCFGPASPWPVVELDLRCRGRLLELNPHAPCVQRDLVDALWDAYEAAHEERDPGKWDYLERALSAGMNANSGREAARTLARFMHNAHNHAEEGNEPDRALEIEQHRRELGSLFPNETGVQNEVAGMLLNGHWYAHGRGQAEIAETYLEELGRFQARPGASLVQGDQWAKALRNAHGFALEVGDWERADGILDRLRSYVDSSEPRRRYRHGRLAAVLATSAAAALERGDREVYQRDRGELVRRCETSLCSQDELEMLEELLEDEPPGFG